MSELDQLRRILALVQTGVTYTKDVYDRERYFELREIAAKMIAKRAQASDETVQNFVLPEKGYATPKIDVRGCVFRGDRILLVQERSDGLWTLPGGWADVNASPAQNVEKEIEEEAGLKTEAVKLLACYDKQRQEHPPELYHTYKLFFLCRVIDGELRPSIETAAAAFFDERELPPLSLDRVTPRQIARMYQHLRDPELATDFD